MTRGKGLRKALLVSVLLLAFGFGATGSVRADDALKMVPSNSLFCVRVNNLDNALGQVELFLTGVFPAPVSMLVKGQLGQILTGNNAQQPQGINTAGSFTVFGPLPGGAGPDPTNIGILIPISDYQQFISGNANVSAANGQGISTIGPAGSPMLAVIQVGKFALAGRAGTEQALAEAKKSLAAGTSALAASLDAAEMKRASSASVWAYANIEAASQLFGPMIQGKIQEIKQAMAAAQEQGASPMAAASGAIDMYATLLETILNEAKYFSLSLNPSAGQIGAGFVVAGKPGSGMAQMLQAGPAKQGNNLLGYLDSGAIMNFVGSMNSPFWKKLNEAYIDMLPQMLGGDTSAGDMEELKKMATDAMDCFGGPIAGSFSANPEGKPPFEVRYVAGLKDAEKFYQLMDAASKMMTSGPIAEFYKNMGMNVSFDLKRKADTYKDVAIDSLTFNLAAADANSQEAQMISAMYGEGFNVQMAAVDGMLVYALAQEPGAAVRKLIDQVKAGGSSQAPSEVQTAMQLIPGAEKADFFTTFNVLRMLQMVAAIAPVPIPTTNVPTQSSMAIASNAGDGKMTIQLAVPKQHVLEIMGMVMQMQQQ